MEAHRAKADGEFWRPADVLAFFKVSKPTLLRWRRRRGFPAPVVLSVNDSGPLAGAPRAIGWRKSDVLAWLAGLPKA